MASAHRRHVINTLSSNTPSFCHLHTVVKGNQYRAFLQCNFVKKEINVNI